MAFQKKKGIFAKKIQRAYRKKRATKPKMGKYVKPRYAEQIQYLKARVNYSLKENDFINVADGSMYNIQYQCPWQNVSATTTNRCYSKDFENMIGNNSSVIQPLYQKYKLNCIVYEFRRPKIAAQGSDNVFQPTTMFGTQICHGKEVYAPNSSTGVVEPVANLAPRIVHTSPSNWSEAVDNLGSQFHIHGYSSSFKRVWKPATPYEKRWRDYTNGDKEIPTGSIYLSFKDQMGVPERTGTTISGETILLEVVATVYMAFKKRL